MEYVKIKFSSDVVYDNWKRVRFKYYAFKNNFSPFITLKRLVDIC